MSLPRNPENTLQAGSQMHDVTAGNEKRLTERAAPQEQVSTIFTGGMRGHDTRKECILCMSPPPTKRDTRHLYTKSAVAIERRTYICHVQPTETIPHVRMAILAAA